VPFPGEGTSISRYPVPEKAGTGEEEKGVWMNNCNRCQNWWKCTEITRQKAIARGYCEEYTPEDPSFYQATKPYLF
jgi:hypothetical protein